MQYTRITCILPVGLLCAMVVMAEDPKMGDRGFVETEGEKIYYETYGEGDTVVFSHGLGGNHAIWYQQVYEFAKRYRVVTWDQRGFGLSTNLNGTAGPEAASRDLKALLDHLEIEQTHLIGQSMGGWTTMGFVLENPERVRSVVFADTIAGIYTPEIEAQFDAYIRSAFSAPTRGAMAFGAHPAVGAKHTQSDPVHSFLYEQIGSAASPPPPTIAKQLRDTAYDTARIGAISAPVLFVVGSDDPIFMPTSIRAASALIPGSAVVEIQDAGHSPYFERPELWNAAVAEFLSGAK